MSNALPSAWYYWAAKRIATGTQVNLLGLMLVKMASGSIYGRGWSQQIQQELWS